MNITPPEGGQIFQIMKTCAGRYQFNFNIVLTMGLRLETDSGACSQKLDAYCVLSLTPGVRLDIINFHLSLSRLTTGMSIEAWISFKGCTALSHGEENNITVE